MLNMHRNIRLFCIALGLMLWPASHASSPHIKVGEATLSVLFWDIYTATLLTTTGTYDDTTAHFHLNLKYLRNIKKDKLIEATEEQWQRLGIAPKQYQNWLETLSSLWPDINKNDSLTLKVNPEYSEFSYNNNVLGTIDDSDFGPLFAAIWLSENSQYPELRNQLIGMKK